MIELQVDLWQIDADVRCVTTNGTVLGDGRNIMGGGCAREARLRHPGVDYHYGSLIQMHGHHVFLIRDLVMFPTKETIDEPASLETIDRSCRELLALTELYGWQKVAVPRPGAGLGGLEWDDVRPLCEFHLHGPRFVIVDFPASVPA